MSLASMLGLSSFHYLLRSETIKEVGIVWERLDGVEKVWELR